MFFHLDDLPLRCDGCETVSCVVGSCSDHGRIMGGSVPHCKWGFTCVSCIAVERIPLWFVTVHGRSCNANGIASGAGGWVADGIPLWFATLGSFPHCKWACKWCWWRSCRWSFEGSLARNAFLRDSRCTKPYVFPPRWSTSAVRRLRDGLVCGRIMFGSWADRFRIVNGVSPVFRAFAVERIPLWFVTAGSFLQCKWDCKWCWWMSCRWSFEGSLARNAFLRDSRCTKPYVFPPRWSTSAVRRLRDGLVCGRIMFGSWADRFRIVNGVSPVFRAFAVDRIPLWFVTR